MKPKVRDGTASPVIEAICLLAVFCVAGCEADRPAETVMPKTLEKAVQEAKAGETFMGSSLSGQAMTVDEAKAAKDYISQHADSSAYMLLMALRKDHPQVYAGISDRTRAKVLCGALKNLTFLNDFGYLEPSGAYDGEAAMMLIDVGKPAIDCLGNLLGDKNEAPLFGSKEATAGSAFGYRRCDFAYRYIMLILSREPTFPGDPADRDKLIAALKRELSRSGE